MPGREPDPEQGAVDARQVGKAMDIIQALTPSSGSYLNEADYFQADWQASFWGENYPRLLEIKRKYDPATVFSVHHGIGSDAMNL
jgi:FAD/FMN-containing dehydrogenase